MTASPCAETAYRLASDEGFCARVGSAVLRASPRRRRGYSYDEARSDVAAALYGVLHRRPISFDRFDPARGTLQNYAARSVLRMLSEFERATLREPAVAAVAIETLCDLPEPERRTAAVYDDETRVRVKALLDFADRDAERHAARYGGRRKTTIEDARNFLQAAEIFESLSDAVRYMELPPRRFAAVRRYLADLGASLGAVQ